MRLLRFATAVSMAALLAACGTASRAPAPLSSGTKPAAAPKNTSSPKPAAPDTLPALPAAKSGRGGYYQDDGPGDLPPAGLRDIPDAEPKIEPYSKSGNKPYVVFGKTYTPITDDRPFSQHGVGSWYGKKFHGQKTSSGEPYDMYKMTAAHPTLPIPSYARVTNLKNGQQIIVRVNDRGPFHSSRIIDLSYTAALKLGYLGSGSSELQVERLLPEDIERMAKNVKAAPQKEVPATAANAAASAVAFVAAPVSAAVSSPVVAGNPAAFPPPAASEARLQEITGMMESDTAAGDTAGKTAGVAAAPEQPASQDAAPVKGIYLQIGAYAQMANAEAARSRLADLKKLALPAIELVLSGDGRYRVYCGPFSSAADAADVAQQLQENGFAKPLSVQR